MVAALLPQDEAGRLAALRALAILDTPAEPLYDDIVRLAAQLCASPIALVSLIDEDRQWFKACIGLESTGTPREQAFCAHAILNPQEPLVVEDATSDPRFCDNPLVTGAPHIRFYAGAPILAANGSALGTLCVIDTEVRGLDDRQSAALRALSRQVGALLQLRSDEIALRRQAEVLAMLSAQSERQRRKSDELLDVVLRGGNLELWDHRFPEKTWICNARQREMLGFSEEDIQPGALDWNTLMHPADRPLVESELRRHLKGETSSFTSEHRMRHKNGGWRWIKSNGLVVERDAAGAALRIVGTDQDITAQREEQEALLHVNAMLQRTSAMARVGGWQLELATGEVGWSDEVFRIHEVAPGFDPSLLLALDFYPPEARPALEEAVRRTMRDGSPYDLELPFITARGRNLWVRAQGIAVRKEAKVVRIVGAFQDITERKTAQLALEKSEERLTLALSGTRSSVFDWNLGTGLVHRGPQFSVMRGGDAVDTVCDGAAVAAMIHPDDLPTVISDSRAALKDEQAAIEVEYRVRSLDERWIWVRTVARVSERSPGGRALRCTGIDEDITVRKEAQLRLEESEARLKAITDNLPVLIAELDTEQRFIFCNATFEQWLGIAPRDLLGRTPADLPANVDTASRAVYLHKALAGQRVTFEQTLNRPSHRILQSTYLPRKDAHGAVVGIYALSSDITGQKEVQQELVRLTRLDPLTGISNRRHFEELLGDAMARSRRSRETLALLYMDIDRFKSINDRHGHAVGDAVLGEYVTRVQTCIRKTDKFARLAGDEFVLLIEPCSDADQAQKVGEKILQAIREPLTVAQDFSGPISTSLGVAIYSGMPGVTPAALLQRADKALYQAKAAGRDCLSFYVDPLDTAPA